MTSKRGRRAGLIGSAVALCLAVSGAAAALAAPLDPLGPQVRVSNMGPDGDAAFDGFNPAVAHNTQSGETLVVWSGDDSTDGENEIWGRLLDPLGSPIGGQFRISSMGPDGDPDYEAANPAVAYNPAGNEYLVVWRGDDDRDFGAGQLADQEFEVFGQRLDATGVEGGEDDFRISEMGTDGDNIARALHPPAVTHNPVTNQYLVVWRGDDQAGGLAAREFEVFGQRLEATGAEIGTDFRISDMGPDGNADYDASTPVVANSPTANEYLVVWVGDDDTSGLADDELEAFGQRVDATGAEIGENDFRISDMGPDGNADFDAFQPDVAHNPAADEYLVVWMGDDNADFGGGPLAEEEVEIFGQRIDATGAEIGENDFRISVMGPEGDPNYVGASPAVTHNPVADEYLVVWLGLDDRPSLAFGEAEFFGQRLGAAGAELGENDRRVSRVGPDGDPSYSPSGRAAVAYNPAQNTYLAAWSGDDLTPPLAPDDELEIFAQTLEGPAQAQPTEEPPGEDRDEPGPELAITLNKGSYKAKRGGKLRLRYTTTAPGKVKLLLKPRKGKHRKRFKPLRKTRSHDEAAEFKRAVRLKSKLTRKARRKAKTNPRKKHTLPVGRYKLKAVLSTPEGERAKDSAKVKVKKARRKR